MSRLVPVLAVGFMMFGPVDRAQAKDIAAVLGWAQRIELGTLVSGVVSRVHVHPGQAVEQGDELISLDARGFESQVARRLAEQRHAQALLEEARREDQRASELYERTVLSDFERNQALLALEAARAVFERSAAALVAARLDLEHSVLRAPFAGVVLAVNVAPGQSVISEFQSDPLVTLASNRTLQARAEVDAERAANLPVGKVLRATLRGRALDASVNHVGYEPIDPSAQVPRYQLILDIDAREQPPLRVGETVILHLE